MTHFNNAVAAYLNYLTALRNGDNYQAASHYQMAKNFVAKYKEQSGIKGVTMCDVIETAKHIRWPNGLAA